MRKKGFIRCSFLGALLALIGLHLAKPLDLIIGDLGRHLKNGEIIWSTLTIPNTNLYAYAFPEYPTLMHHWGSSLIFYIVQHVSGFSGLHLFGLGLYLATAGVGLCYSLSRNSVVSVLITTILCLPLLSTRAEVRPEGLSYLFISMYLWILLSYTANRDKKMWLLPVLQLVWVNTHIYFVLGLGLIGMFWILDQVKIKTKIQINFNPQLTLVLVTSVITSFINPYGWKTIFEPFTIINTIQEYFLVENLPVWRYLQFYDDWAYWLFVGLLAITAYLFFNLHVWTNLEEYKYPLAFLAIFAYIGLDMVRNSALFGYVALFFLPGLFDQAGLNKNSFKTGLIFVILGLHIWPAKSPYNLLADPPGLGIDASQYAAKDFLLTNQIQGPIFNNYNIGGYLIYYLYPERKVFVDNRPEAYPESFFLDTYIPLQTSEAKWQEVDSQFGFNVLVITVNDLAPEFETLLDNRYQDPAWKLVFQDKKVVIFVRDIPKNAQVIREYALN